MSNERVLDPTSPDFVNDLMDNIATQLEESIRNHPNKCTRCKKNVSLSPGKNICPHCNEELNLIVTFAN